jgi:transposase
VCRVPMEAREVAIIKRMKKVMKMPVMRIAKMLGRHKKTVYKALKMKSVPRRGRAALLTPQDVRRMVSVLRSMVKAARACWEVTLAMIKKKAKVKACDKTVRRALAKKNIKFRRMRSKIILSKADMKARYAFAKKYKSKSASWWLKHIQLHIDCKTFPAYVTAQARDLAAQREVRGVYRKPGEGLDECYVVAPKSLRANPGCKAVKIAAGVAQGKIVLWHDYGLKWNGKVAADVYEGPMLAALQKTWPRRRSFNVLEDNDPTGFKSKAAVRAKAAARIEIFTIPARSPDLNVLDYAIWKAVTRKMRAQERSFPRSKRESRTAYIARLRRAAMSVPTTTINKAIMNMKHRCNLMYLSKGGHIQEGRRSR